MIRPETCLGRVKFWEDRAKEGLVPKLGSTGLSLPFQPQSSSPCKV